MPPFVIPDLVQARLYWTLDGADRAQNVLHFNNGGAAVGQGDADEMATSIINALAASDLLLSLANEWTLDRVGVRSIDSANLPEFLADVNATGGSATDTLPPAVTLCVTLRTAMAGRSFRGRVYLPGWSEGSSLADGQASTASRTRAASFISQLAAQAVLNLGWSFVVASRSLGTGTLVSSATVRDGVWDTQRRRASGTD